MYFLSKGYFGRVKELVVVLRVFVVSGFGKYVWGCGGWVEGRFFGFLLGVGF